MFVITVHVKYSLIALAQVRQCLQYLCTIVTNIAGYDAHGTGGTPGPVKLSPGFYM
jgi:hypothetical protein